MPDVLIRNIDKETLERLKERARLNNRSLQEELRQLLRTHSGVEMEAARKMVREIQEKYEAEGKTFPDSTEEIREERLR